jgi:hypothetical protein
MNRPAITNLNGLFIKSQNRNDAQGNALPEAVIDLNTGAHNRCCRAEKVNVRKRKRVSPAQSHIFISKHPPSQDFRRRPGGFHRRRSGFHLR